MAKEKTEYPIVGYIFFVIGVLVFLFASKLSGGLIGLIGYFPSKSRAEKILNTLLAIVGIAPTVIAIIILIISAIQGI